MQQLPPQQTEPPPQLELGFVPSWALMHDPLPSHTLQVPHDVPLSAFTHEPFWHTLQVPHDVPLSAFTHEPLPSHTLQVPHGVPEDAFVYEVHVWVSLAGLQLPSDRHLLVVMSL